MTANRIAAGVVVILVLLYLTRPKGTVTTSEVFSLAPSDYPDRLKETARAIARAEGFYVPGSIPERAHNPGNLKVGAPTLGTSGITVFDSDELGWAALYRQLARIIEGRSAHYTLDTTIAEMGRKWTATEHEQSAWASNVAGALGVGVETPLNQVLL